MSDTQRRNIKLSPSALISSPGAAAARDASKIPQDICYIYMDVSMRMEHHILVVLTSLAIKICTN